MNCSSSNLMNFILAFTELPHSSRSDCGMWIKIGCLWASIDECEECFRLHHFILRALELNVHNNYKFGVINWCHGNWKHWWQCRYYFYNYDIFPVAYKLLKNSAWQRINKSHGEWHLSPCFVPSRRHFFVVWKLYFAPATVFWKSKSWCVFVRRWKLNYSSDFTSFY